MEPNQRSRTAEVVAVMRILHQTLDEDPILIDPIAPRLLDLDEGRQRAAPLLNHAFAKQFRAGFALRARYGEDCLCDAVQRGVKQYVILGAGLDTFAYRQPVWANTLQIYEVDHPVTQQWKREQLKAAHIDIPANLTFVPIDFERTTIADALVGSGFAFTVKTLCSWMGVTQYLPADALDAVFRFVLSLAPSSEIVFSIILPSEAMPALEAEAVEAGAQRAAEFGEPWLTRLVPTELAAKLRSMGFSEIVHLTPEQADDRYFRNRRDGLMARRGEQMIRAIV